MLNSAFNLFITSKSRKHILTVEADSLSVCNYYLFNYGPVIDSVSNGN
jgi:hypothetical protein